MLNLWGTHFFSIFFIYFYFLFFFWGGGPLCASTITDLVIGARRHTGERRLQPQWPPPAAMKTLRFPVHSCLTQVAITPLIYEVYCREFLACCLLGLYTFKSIRYDTYSIASYLGRYTIRITIRTVNCFVREF